jgi:nicotinamidase-related amidase
VFPRERESDGRTFTKMDGESDPRMKSQTAFILIDTQLDMLDPAHPVDDAEPLLALWRALVAHAHAAGAQVLIVRHDGGAGDPLERGKPGWELHPSLRPVPGDILLDKTTNDTFESTPLGDELEARGIRRVVIAGLQSEFCVRATTLGALARGLEVTLVENGHGTYGGGGRSAAEISAAVNAELASRVTLADAAAVRFD